MSLMTFLLADGIGKIVTNIVNHLIIHMTMHFLTFFSKEIRELEGCKLGNNCIQNFHLGRYIVGYTVGNLV